MAKFPLSVNTFHDLRFHAADTECTAVFTFDTFRMIFKNNDSRLIVQQMNFRRLIGNQFNIGIGFLNSVDDKIRIYFFYALINIRNRNHRICICTTPK